MITARLGCPLLLGLGEGENFIASDVSAVLSVTRKVIYLEDGDVADIRRDGVTIFGRDGAEVTRKIHVSDVSLASMELYLRALYAKRNSRATTCINRYD